MTPLLLCALGLAAAAPPVRLDRVELLAEDPGTWLNYEALQLPGYPVKGVLRFVTQVRPVLELPVEHLYVGLSLSSQSLVYERPFSPGLPFTWSAGVQTQLLLPRGALATVAWRHGPVRLSLGLSAVSGATWARPDWSEWDLLPTVGVGLVRQPRPRPEHLADPVPVPDAEPVPEPVPTADPGAE